MPSELKNVAQTVGAANRHATVQAHHTLQQARVFYENGRFEQAQALCQEMLHSYPNHVDTLYLSGVLAYETGQLQGAAEWIGKVVEIEPNYAEAWNSLGLVLFNARQHKFALLNFDRAIALKPDYAEAYNNRGISFIQLKQHDAAIQNFDRAIALKPDYAEAFYNRGNTLSQLRQHDAAMQSFDRAIALKPDYAEAYNSRGNALSKIRQYDAAIQCYDHAISIRPGYPEPHYNKSVILLYRNEFEPGWREYEWRWKTKKWNSKKLETDKPVWSGGKSTKRLLIWAEQGLGDQIFFGSLLREVSAFPQKKIATFDRRLIPIFTRSIPGIEYSSIDKPMASEFYDEQIYLASLPRFFRPSIAEFGNNATPFLKCNELLRDALRRKIKKPGKFTCGLSWFSQNPSLGENKSLALDQLLPILKINNIDFVDLQYGDTSQERESLEALHDIKIRKLGEIDNANSIDDLASLVMACDFVITTSNITAHLAGALGQRTLLLAPFGMQIIWYWTHIDGISLWYPSIRVYEQPALGDWGGCIEVVKKYLERMLCQ